MGRFGMPRGRAGMGRFAIQNAAWAGRGGGEGVSIAEALAGTATNVMAISFVDGSMVIRDTTTPANDYNGPYSSKLTINGSLPINPAGALFSDTNNATIATSAFCFSATEGSLAIECTPTSIDASVATPRVCSFNDGTTSNIIDVRLSNTNSPDNYVFQVQSGGAGQASIARGEANITGNSLFAGWKANDFLFRVTGDSNGDGTDNSGSIPTVSRFDIGYASHTASRGFPGRIKSIVYKPLRTG